MLSFTFTGVSYYTNIISKNSNRQEYIEGYCDTGCTRSSIGLYSLSKLLGIPSKDLLEYFEKRINKGYVELRTAIANGSTMRTIPVRLYNIQLDSLHFEYLNCLVNIDDILVQTNGYRELNESQLYKVQPFMLIGLDILRAFDKVILDKNKIECRDFNENVYNSYWANTEGIITLYMDQICNEIKTDKYDEFKAFVNNNLSNK